MDNQTLILLVGLIVIPIYPILLKLRSDISYIRGYLKLNGTPQPLNTTSPKDK